ncbi:hypothetical protein EBB59_06935 [Lysobacter pythonis]|uniref:Uncharacterized protein n=1 Tax=Solilutibacter pythonis TaxID=2483112 RepID=A0A3M2HXG6_9GAMM|nr:hypothetical protein [Lysobacter pythonis]RMH92955.1 hypothetical protein EBB59_06935 [Lysobacter pythonis]
MAADTTPGIDLAAIATALNEDDVDAALGLGLLDWPGDSETAYRAGLADTDIATLKRVRDERLAALAARERHRARAARLARQAGERRQRQSDTLANGPTGKPALSGAAAAALARALAKAKR